MKIYNSYKDSNIEWIGKIPSHWTILRGKYWTKIISGFAFDSNKFTKEEGYIGIIRIRDIYKTETEMNYKGSYSKDAIVQTGDILIGMDGDFNIERWKGKPALLNQRVCKICNTKKGNENYLFYLLPRLLKCINDVTYSTTVKHLSVYDIINSELPLPPLSEQQAIATYLDKKCGEINHAIDVQKNKIDLLGELKQTIITDAVTKGLNPNAPMKDSGVEWIGEVPQHWEVRRLKTLCKSIRNGYVGPTRDLYQEFGIPYIQSVHIKDGDILFEREEYYVSEEWAKKHPKIKKGNILVVQTGDIGQIALVNAKYDLCNCHALIILDINNNVISSEFLSLYLRSNIGKELMLQTKTGALLPHLNSTQIGSTKALLPSFQEQQSIVAYIEKETTKIDSQITKANRRIELLEELKQSIITEAVTGKIKVC